MQGLEWDYREYYRETAEGIPADLSRVLSEPNLANGDEVRGFESECAEVANRAYAIGVSSCTAGLMLSLRLLAPRSRVIVPWFSFCATVLPILWNESQIVYGMIDPSTFNLDFEWTKRQLESKKADAVVFLATAGSVSGLCEFEDLTSFFHVPLIVDAAGGFGAHEHGCSARRPDAQIVSVVSFASKKILPIGDGGMIFTDNKELDAELRKLRVYGSEDGYFCGRLGLNARMTEVTAAVGRTMLKGFGRVVEARRSVSRQIVGATSDLVDWQKIGQHSESSYADVLGLVDREARPGLIASFRGLGLEAVPFYDPAVPLHPAFSARGTALSPEVREQLQEWSGRTFSFRPNSSFTAAHVDAVVGAIRHRP